jgi:mannan endo-1,4-beta-mannosidase
MKTKTIMIAAALALPFVCCCGGNNPDPDPVKPEPVELTLVDANATPETKALYANLWAIRDKGWIFGHQNDLINGRKWQYDEGGSDTKAVCGDYPGLFGVDVASFMDGREDTSENPVKVRTIKEAYDRGMVIMACMHLNNPYNDAAYADKKYNQDRPVSHILEEGSETNRKFNVWMDRLAALAKSLKGSDGVQIPMILRPFHEHGNDWSWWGNTACTQTEYIDLWRLLVDGMKSRGVHNFIYAISPQMDGQKIEDDFLFRWPGDNYVDFIGMDCYQGINNNVFVNNLKVLSALSTKKKKPAGVTETGVQGFQVADYWVTNIAAPMAGRKMSLLATWSNKYDPIGSGNHYFSVFPGHVSVESFLTMYKRSDTYFCNDLPKMYNPVNGITVK